jgi:hypothetical protein
MSVLGIRFDYRDEVSKGPFELVAFKWDSEQEDEEATVKWTTHSAVSMQQCWGYYLDHTILALY